MHRYIYIYMYMYMYMYMYFRDFRKPGPSLILNHWYQSHLLSYFSRVGNWDVWKQAFSQQLHSTTLQTLQFKSLPDIVRSCPEDPLHSIAFCHPLRDRMRDRGRRQRMQIPFWTEGFRGLGVYGFRGLGVWGFRSLGVRGLGFYTPALSRTMDTGPHRS